MHDGTVLLASSTKICQLLENNHATWLTVCLCLSVVWFVISHHKRLVNAFGLISSTAPATSLCLCCVFYTSTKLIIKLVIKNRETAVQGDVNCFHCFYKWCFVLAKEMVFVLAGIIGNFSSQWYSLLDQVLLLYHLSILQLSEGDYVVAVPDGKQCILQMSF